MNDLYIGMDIGGSKLIVGVGTLEGEIKGAASMPVPRRMRPQEVIDSLAELTNLSLRKAGVIWKEVKGIGISFGGPVDFKNGITITCNHLPGWNNVPLVKVMKAKLHLPAHDLPVVIDNDANAAALGEARFGAGRGAKDFLFLAISSGIGGGLIMDGSIYRGAASLAGEVGHTIIRPDGPTCTCGKNGCLEALASGWSIARRAKEALTSSDQESLLRTVPENELDAKMVSDAAQKGDALALTVMEDAADALGQGIAAVINILNLPLVVIGGGVAKSGDVLFCPLQLAVKKYAMNEIGETTKVVPGDLRERAPILGAIALAATPPTDIAEKL